MLWTLWLLWGLVLSCGIFGVWSTVRSSPRQAVVVLAIALLAWALRGGIARDYFYGLEYEDAYVYAAAARQSALTNSGSNFGGLTVCAVGSLENCSVTEVSPGHLPGFPAVLRGAQAVVGYRVWLGPTVGALISSITVLVVWWSASVIYQSSLAAAVAALLFAATPALTLYGGSATSESVSSLPIAVAIGATAMARRSTRTSAWWSWHAAVLLAVLLATTVRRENAVLIGVLPVCLLSCSADVGTRFRRAGIFVWLAVAALVVWLVFPSLVNEVGEYGQFSFGVSRVFDTFPTILRALVTPRWFGIAAILGALGVAGAIANMHQKRRDQDGGFLIAVAAAAFVMVALYAAHVRSTYQLMGEAVEPFDFLRYLANIGVFVCVLAPAAAHFVTHRTSASTRGWLVMFVIAGAYLAFSTWSAWTLRGKMVSAEAHARVEPALAAIDAAAAFEDRFPIVTLEPLVLQLYGNPGTKVIALEFLTEDRVKAAGGRVLYVRQDHYENDVNRRRYAKFLSALPIDNVVELRKGSGWAVLAMGAVSSKLQ